MEKHPNPLVAEALATEGPADYLASLESADSSEFRDAAENDYGPGAVRDALAILTAIVRHGAPVDSTIRSWSHTRKGRLTGILLRELGDWSDVLLVDDHRVVPAGYGLYAGGGEVLRVRTTFLAPVVTV